MSMFKRDSGHRTHEAYDRMIVHAPGMRRRASDHFGAAHPVSFLSAHHFPAHLSHLCTYELLSLLLVSYCYGGEQGHGANGADFLKITPDSKVAALGNSGVANPKSDFSVFHNPSLLSQSPDGFRLAASQMNWLLGVRASHYAVSYSWGALSGKTWGIGLFISDWRTGAFGATDPYGNFAGQVEYRAQNMGIGFSRAMMDSWHWGFSVKRIAQFFQESGGSSAKKTGSSVLAWDAGTHYAFSSDRFIVGAVVQNIGPKVGFEEKTDHLPLMVRFGARGKGAENGFSWNLEAVHEQDNALSVKSGISFEPFSKISFRAGYDTFISQSNYVGFTTGLGFEFREVHIDYSFVPFGELGTTQRFSMSWHM